MLSLTPEDILLAYQHGIFPMHDNESNEILWFQPDPRTILPLEGLHISRSLAKTLRQGYFEIRINTAFEEVMRGCADRPEGTWISEDFITVYTALHRQGMAHSVETWRNGRLVGGTYGVALGGAFMAESMFHYETDASKVALVALVRRLRERGFRLLDVQYLTSHLARFGAIEIRCHYYLNLLANALPQRCRFD